jgi:hypothetical protein
VTTPLKTTHREMTTGELPSARLGYNAESWRFVRGADALVKSLTASSPGLDRKLTTNEITRACAVLVAFVAEATNTEIKDVVAQVETSAAEVAAAAASNAEGRDE